MRLIRSLSVSWVLTSVVAAQCGSSSLTTIFAANNGGSSGWGLFFDVNVVNPAGINICGFDVNAGNTAVGTLYTLDAYVTPGSHVPVHGIASAWRLVSSGSGVAAGNNVPAPTPLGIRMYLPFGSYGVALYVTGASIRYTNGTGTNQVYSNADLTITCGLSRSALFSGTINNPRVWNGTVHYDTCSPTSPAGIGFFAAGCGGSLPVTNLQPQSTPQIGGVFVVDLNNLPQASAVLIVGLSNTTSTYGPLPLDTTSFGAPGCFVHVSPELFIPLVGVGTTATFSFGVPLVPALQCLQFYMQAGVTDPGFNAAGVVLSDAVAGIIGL
jgi:hypothetical protein